MEAVDLPPFETAENRFVAMTKAQHAPPRPYRMDEAVWRPDGKGVNETIFSPFMWNGRRVRALKPVTKDPRGEQHSGIKPANDNEFIGLMLGDKRYQGLDAWKEPGRRDDGKAAAGGRGRSVNSMAGLHLRASRDEDHQAVAKAADQMAMQDALASAINAGGGRQSVRPMGWLHRDIAQRTMQAHENYVGSDNQARDFLMDETNNPDMHRVPVAATERGLHFHPYVDMNYGADYSQTHDARDARVTMLSRSDEFGINGYGNDDRYDEGTGGMSDVRTATNAVSTRDPHNVNRYNKGSAVTETGREEVAPGYKAPLAQARRFRVREHQQGAQSMDNVPEELNAGYRAPLAQARRFRVREHQQGAQSMDNVPEELNAGYRAPLAPARRLRSRETPSTRQTNESWSTSAVENRGGERFTVSARRNADRVDRLVGAVRPTEAIDAGMVQQESRSVRQTPHQEHRARQRIDDTGRFGASFAATDGLTNAALARANPAAHEDAARMFARPMKLRDRTEEMTIVNDGYWEATRKLRQQAYATEDKRWEAGRGKKVKAIYESEAESSGDEA